LGIAGQSFPWLGRQANNANHYPRGLRGRLGETKENEADTKELKGFATGKTV
jgi:hypothetical protein